MRLVKRDYETTRGLKKVKVDVYQDNFRDGMLSPKSVYYKYKGRWITQYEMKKKHWAGPSLNLLFTIVYGDKLPDILYNKNPLLNLFGTENYKPAIIPMPLETK